MLLLRRIYRAPELFQLLATFALVLIVQGRGAVAVGPEDLLGAARAGAEGRGRDPRPRFPTYDLFLIASARRCWARCGCC
jgi:branched-chain amino acid transport system permease protein